MTDPKDIIDWVAYQPKKNNKINIARKITVNFPVILIISGLLLCTIDTDIFWINALLALSGLIAFWWSYKLYQKNSAPLSLS